MNGTALPPELAGLEGHARLRLLIRGAVQGVGFRPFVHRRATALGLAGWVANSPAGVTVEAEGTADRLVALVRAIRETPPAHARVAAVEARRIAPHDETAFAIRPSGTGGARSAEVLPDLATCDDCLRELFDPGDRRHLYPFINCTQCGPRYSIVEALPYDRARTSMRHFAMCPACRAEYDDPADRRFHAEPNACPACGPRLALWGRTGTVLARDHAALGEAAAALRRGLVVAVKGIGGFHLLVDARDEAAVRELRVRKRREAKPFAVMFPSLEGVAESCRVGPVEEELLSDPARPIVLLRRSGGPIAPAVAPGNPWLGALLAYAPLHHLLMRELGFPVVATSGNLSDEPIVTDERAALGRLGGIADLFLVHDRPIVRPLDDSVMRVVAGRELMLRRGRGHAPAPLAVDGIEDGILALGGHLKATVALSGAGEVTVSQHLGDLGSAEAHAVHARAAADIAALHERSPGLVACDLHPDYASTRAAVATGLPAVEVPHHLAHVAACMAEHGMRPPALGVAWDGAGYGPDGTVWGGEFLLIEADGWHRLAHLRRFRLPGGEAAMREPRRAALGLLHEAFGDDAFAMTELAPVATFSGAERKLLRTALARGVNAPLTSSAGRLFDAVAALCGLRQRAGYEGQAAAELEWAADGAAGGAAYRFELVEQAAGDAPLVIDWQPALEALLADLGAGRGAAHVSRAFHDGLAEAIASVSLRSGDRPVVLSGGCFQNVRLTETTVAALRRVGREPVWHRRVPPNDGGLALGQAWWASRVERKGGAPCAWRSPAGC